jgi:hypothetical protein
MGKESIALRYSTATVVALEKGMSNQLFVNGIGITKLNPITKMTGIESIQAPQTPVKAFVPPGPEVTNAAPGFPVIRALPSAAMAAACSWWVLTLFISVFVPRESSKCMAALPETANTSLIPKNG